MVAIKEMVMPRCCGNCVLVRYHDTLGYSCKKRGVEILQDNVLHKRADDCPLVEIGTCKECKYYTVYEIEYFQTNQKEQFSYCEKYDRLGNNHLSPDFYCGDFKKRGDENE